MRKGEPARNRVSKSCVGQPCKDLDEWMQPQQLRAAPHTGAVAPAHPGCLPGIPAAPRRARPGQLPPRAGNKRQHDGPDGDEPTNWDDRGDDPGPGPSGFAPEPPGARRQQRQEEQWAAQREATASKLVACAHTATSSCVGPDCKCSRYKNSTTSMQQLGKRHTPAVCLPWRLMWRGHQNAHPAPFGRCPWWV